MSMSARPLIAAAVVLATTAAPAAATTKPQRFVASVTARQVSTWNEGPWDVPTSRCSRATGEARGQLTTVLRTAPLRVTALRAGGSLAIAYGSLRHPQHGFAAKGTVRGQYFSQSRFLPGACEPGPVLGSDQDRDESCEATPRWTVQLASQRPGTLTPLFLDAAPDVTNELLSRCVVYTPQDASKPLTAIPARVSSRKIFDRDEEYVIVTGRRTFTQRQELSYAPREMTTTMTWKLRMRRAR